jgi:hypothetical protein
MCFSPEVSFATAGVLVGLGGYCLSLARHRPGYWAFAVIPLGFGLQQAAEGIVWLGVLRSDAGLVHAGTSVFLFFALGFWPTWFALAAAVAEPAGWRRQVLSVFALLTTAWFWLAFVPALTGPPECLAAHLAGHSVHYNYGDEVIVGDTVRWPVAALYSVCVAGPLLLMSRWRATLLMVALGGASVISSAWAYAHAFTSVWCFFAALLSAYTAYFIATAQPTVPA